MLTKFLPTSFCATHKLTLLLLVLFPMVNPLKAQTPAARVTGKSSFTAKLMNIEGATNEVFRYATTLHNGDSKSKLVELKAQLPTGWMISYKVDGSAVTSLAMDAGKTQDIFIEINATSTADPNKYKIPVKAISAVDTLVLNLEAVVKGSYGLMLTTPSGRLSEEVTSGSHTDLQLTVKNSGTLPLNNIDLSSQLPANWEASFEPQKISSLAPGKQQEIKAKLKVPDKTIAGDYSATFTASSANGNAPAAFRIIVKTSLLSGWIGIMVILLSISLVYYLVRKYGRR
ncbi:NEW3 domain-containing protein [Pedobacter sp. ASV28]|uniref:COG1470 family protein n=1 Tax=Pedobacter sp. ASV28 TaxID=2795123 RepID=UPI001E61A959|nr:NEW3 domain-containing protein [Pedobacter sp. ASV28]